LIGTNVDDFGYGGMALDSDGNLFVAGSNLYTGYFYGDFLGLLFICSFSQIVYLLIGSSDIFILKFNGTSGELLFGSRIGDIGADTSTSLMINEKGELYSSIYTFFFLTITFNDFTFKILMI